MVSKLPIIRRFSRLILAAFLVSVVAAHGLARRLDGPSHPVLDLLVDALDAKNVDVITSWKVSKAPLQRPTLGPLRDYPTHVSIPSGQDWMRGFIGPDVGHILAVQSAPRAYPAGKQRESLARAWKRAPPGKRVFISFAKEDLVHAQAIRDAFRTKGYETFLFLQDGASKPDLSIQDVRKYFDQADYRVVLDTPNARASEGVWLEAKLAPRLSPRQRYSNPRDAFLDPDRPAFDRATNRLSRVLGKEQAIRIARQAPDAAALERVAQAASLDPTAQAAWRDLNELGAQLAFEGEARIAFKLRAEGSLDALRQPIRTAVIGARIGETETAYRRLVEMGLSHSPFPARSEPFTDGLDRIDRQTVEELDKLRSRIRAMAAKGGSPERARTLRSIERGLASNVERLTVGRVLRMLVRKVR